MKEFFEAINTMEAAGVWSSAYASRAAAQKQETLNSYFYLLLLDTVVCAQQLRRSTRRPNLTGVFGRTLIELSQSRNLLQPKKLLCCSSAEGKLQSALATTEASFEQGVAYSDKPLLLIQHAGKVVAVQKNIDTPSIYAISSVPEVGLVAHTFSASLRHIRPHIIDTLEPAMFIDASAYDGFIPLRIAASIFSAETISTIPWSYSSVPWSAKSLETSVSHISDQCQASFTQDMLNPEYSSILSESALSAEWQP